MKEVEWFTCVSRCTIKTARCGCGRINKTSGTHIGDNETGIFWNRQVGRMWMALQKTLKMLLALSKT